VAIILEGILKGLIEWCYGLTLECWQYFSQVLIDIFSMDLAYLRAHVPVMDDLLLYITAAGWALLLGNLVFQAVRSMMSGLGFEGEDPKILFARTFIFGFLLLASQQICEIALGITTTIIDYLEIPDAVNIIFPDETSFDGLAAAWIVVVIVGIIIMFKTFRLIFEIAERYVVVGVLTLMSPLAFSMGGSKSTSDIFTGWCRMYGSMCLVMITNVVFLKMLLSVLSSVPSGISVLPWMVLVMSIVKVAQKVDGIITRIGLNPAITGGPARGLPGMLTYAVIRTLATTAAKSVGNAKGGGGGSARASGSGTPPPGGNPRAGGPRPSGASAGKFRGAGAGRSSAAGSSAGTAGTNQTNSQTQTQYAAQAAQVSHSSQNSQTVQHGQAGQTADMGAKASRESTDRSTGRTAFFGGVRPSRRSSVDRTQGTSGIHRPGTSGMHSKPGVPGQMGQPGQGMAGQASRLDSRISHTADSAVTAGQSSDRGTKPDGVSKGPRITSVPAGMAGKGAPGKTAASRQTQREAIYTGDTHQSVAANQSTHVQNTAVSPQTAGRTALDASRPASPHSGKPVSESGRPTIVPSGGSYGKVASAGAAEKPTRRSDVRSPDPRVAAPPTPPTSAGMAGKTTPPSGEQPVVAGVKAPQAWQETRQSARSTSMEQRRPPVAGTAGSAAPSSIKKRDSTAAKASSQLNPTASHTLQHGKQSQKKIQTRQPQHHTRRPGGGAPDGRK